MLQTVRVDLGRNSYEVLIGLGIFDQIPSDLSLNPVGERYAIIADDVVAKSYGRRLYDDLRRSDIDAVLIEFDGGERSKNWTTVEYIVRQLTKHRLRRNSALLALGGGVTTDLTGYTACGYMGKGIPYVNIPTSFASQADTSIGGKVRINVANKNDFGFIYQPKKVYTDPLLLQTLPSKELRSGIIEGVKVSMALDKEFFEWWEENLDDVLNLKQDALLHAVSKSVEIKAGVVIRDENEENERHVLNLGHTVGHANEALKNYRSSHGYEVNYGLRVAGAIAVIRGFLDREDFERQIRLLDRINRIRRTVKNPEALIDRMYFDKKAGEGHINFVLQNGIGSMASINGGYRIPVTEREIMEALKIV